MPKVSKSMRIWQERELFERNDQVYDDRSLGYSALGSFDGRGGGPPPYKLGPNLGRQKPATKAIARRCNPKLSTGSQVSRVSSFARSDQAPATIQFMSHAAATQKRESHGYQLELNQVKTERKEVRHGVSQVVQRVEIIERRVDNQGQRQRQPRVQKGCTAPQNGRTKCPYCAKDLAAGSLQAHKKRFHEYLL